MKKIYLLILLIFMAFFTSACSDNDSGNSNNGGNDNNSWSIPADATPPSTTVKLRFIHHSTGSDWISSACGGLGTELNANNYYVNESDYGWDAETDDNLGDTTDTTDWPNWFNDTKMPYVYSNNAHFDYTNTISDPGGENEIIMFKSCYPNSEVGSSIDDEKAIYNGLLTYFAAHTEKMFVLIVPPPEIEINTPDLTRELANWLIDPENGWLADYAHTNVYAYDYYNVLTDPNNHHRFRNGKIEHIITSDPEDPDFPNELYYYSGSDNHPTCAGHQKATDEFVLVLNGFYNMWQGK